MKAEIPMPAVIAAVIVILGLMGFMMYRASTPAMRPAGSPSNLEKLRQTVAKETGRPIFKNPRKD
jgi:hypothetical protein